MRPAAFAAAALIAGLGAPAEARAAEGDVVEVIDDAPPSRAVAPRAAPSRPDAPRPQPTRPAGTAATVDPSASKLTFRGFARVFGTAGLDEGGNAPAAAPPDERVGYERGDANGHVFLEGKYSKGEALRAVLSASLAYGAHLAEGGAGQIGAARAVVGGRVEPVLREAYLGIFTERIDVRLGQQRIVWGNSDGIAPNDVLGARDARNRMQPDGEIAHLPTPAARVDVDLGPAVVQLVAQPVFVADRTSLYGRRWSMVQAGAPRAYRRLLGAYSRRHDLSELEAARDAVVDDRTPRGILETGAIGARVRTHVGKVDLSVYYHWGFERTPYLHLDPTVAAQVEALGPASLDGALFDAALERQRQGAAKGPLTVKHYRRHHLGLDASTTIDPFVLRLDVAWDSATTFTSRRTFNSVVRPVVQGVAAVEYQGGGGRRIVALEGWAMRILGPEQRVLPVADLANGGPLLFANETNAGLGALVRWRVGDDFLFESRAFVGLTPGWFTFRPEFGYDTASFTARVGLLFLDGEAGTFGDYYRRNDAVYTTARWSF